MTRLSAVEIDAAILFEEPESDLVLGFPYDNAGVLDHVFIGGRCVCGTSELDDAINGPSGCTRTELVSYSSATGDPSAVEHMSADW